jgi:hypothetical protein
LEISKRAESGEVFVLSEETAHVSSHVVEVSREDYRAAFVCRAAQFFTYENETRHGQRKISYLFGVSQLTNREYFLHRSFTSESDFSDTIDLVFPPLMDEGDYEEYFYDAEVGVLEIPFSFASRPRPQDDMVIWKIENRTSLVAGEEERNPEQTITFRIKHLI